MNHPLPVPPKKLFHEKRLFRQKGGGGGRRRSANWRWKGGGRVRGRGKESMSFYIAKHCKIILSDNYLYSVEIPIVNIPPQKNLIQSAKKPNPKHKKKLNPKRGKNTADRSIVTLQTGQPSVIDIFVYYDHPSLRPSTAPSIPPPFFPILHHIRPSTIIWHWNLCLSGHIQCCMANWQCVCDCASHFRIRLTIISLSCQ